MGEDLIFSRLNTSSYNVADLFKKEPSREPSNISPDDNDDYTPSSDDAHTPPVSDDTSTSETDNNETVHCYYSEPKAKTTTPKTHPLLTRRLSLKV